MLIRHLMASNGTNMNHAVLHTKVAEKETAQTQMQIESSLVMVEYLMEHKSAKRVLTKGGYLLISINILMKIMMGRLIQVM